MLLRVDGRRLPGRSVSRQQSALCRQRLQIVRLFRQRIRAERPAPATPRRHQPAGEGDEQQTPDGTRNVPPRGPVRKRRPSRRRRSLRMLTFDHAQASQYPGPNVRRDQPHVKTHCRNTPRRTGFGVASRWVPRRRNTKMAGRATVAVPPGFLALPRAGAEKSASFTVARRQPHSGSGTRLSSRVDAGLNGRVWRRGGLSSRLSSGTPSARPTGGRPSGPSRWQGSCRGRGRRRVSPPRR